MKSIFIFNQYYIDLLKRIKDIAKKNREEDREKYLLKTIKENYQTLDKNSEEYILYVQKQISPELWNKFVESSEQWLEDNKDIELYKGISLIQIKEIMQDEYLCLHFFSVFYIFQEKLEDTESENIVKILQSVDAKTLIDELSNEKIKAVLARLQELRNKKIKDKSGIDMNFIEDTTIGKLAKEILEDIDVAKLQKSMGEKGDVLQAIGDPESGFADIITNVSKKMASKISSGELKQESLIQDAMKFASVMPNIFGGHNNKGAKGNMPDISNLMSMMSSMMGNGENKDDGFNETLKNFAKQATKNPHGTKKSFNEGALKKIAKAKKLKKKLMQKKKNEEASED